MLLGLIVFTSGALALYLAVIGSPFRDAVKGFMNGTVVVGSKPKP